MMNFSYLNSFLEDKGGFNFDNLNRNRLLHESSMKLLKAAGEDNYDFHYHHHYIKSKFKKTGTTICGVVTKEGVVLGADTRATEGDVIAEKNCLKLHILSENVWTAGAGVSADLDHITSLFRAKMELESMFTGRQCRVKSVVTQITQLLFKYGGHIHVALVLGGVDCKGPQLFRIGPDGYQDSLPFCSMGSGSLAALSVLEAGYKDGLGMEEGKRLVAAAIRSGVFNDLGSGGNVDLCVINLKGEGEVIRGFDKPTERMFRSTRPVKFEAGTTPVLFEQVQELRSRLVVEDVSEDVVMAD